MLFALLGSFLLHRIGLGYQKNAFMSPFMLPMTKPTIFGTTKSAFRRNILSVLETIKVRLMPPIISGRWAIPVHAVPAPKSFMIMANIFGVVCRARQKKTAIAILKSGTSSLCNSIATLTAQWISCLSRPSIPEWDWSV